MWWRGLSSLLKQLIESEEAVADHFVYTHEPLTQLVLVCSCDGDVPEFAAWSCILPVHMKVCSGDLEDVVPVGERSDEVDHCARAAQFGTSERHSGDCSEMVLELTCGGTFDRPMPAVVYTRGDFIRDQASFDVEHLEC